MPLGAILGATAADSRPLTRMDTSLCKQVLRQASVSCSAMPGSACSEKLRQSAPRRVRWLFTIESVVAA